MDKEIHKHVFTFNPQSNGGESLILATRYHDVGDPEACTSQELMLNSYCNAASFNLMGVQLTPANLRELANQLESAEITANSLLSKKTG